MESKETTIEIEIDSVIYVLEVEIHYYEGTYSIDPTEGEDWEYMGHTVWNISGVDLKTDQDIIITKEIQSMVESKIDFESELEQLF